MSLYDALKEIDEELYKLTHGPKLNTSIERFDNLKERQKLERLACTISQQIGFPCGRIDCNMCSYDADHLDRYIYWELRDIEKNQTNSN